mgnify:CR=1 FL=1
MPEERLGKEGRPPSTKEKDVSPEAITSKEEAGLWGLAASLLGAFLIGEEIKGPLLGFYFFLFTAGFCLFLSFLATQIVIKLKAK